MRDKQYLEKLEIGDEKVITIEGFGSKGNPFCKINGLVVFINISHKDTDLREGDVLRVKIISKKEKFAFSEIVNYERLATNE